MTECISVYDDYLAHHGILGMKWGIRRYQNADGSLTAAGKKRYMGDYTSNASRTAESGTTKRLKRAIAGNKRDIENIPNSKLFKGLDADEARKGLEAAGDKFKAQLKESSKKDAARQKSDQELDEKLSNYYKNQSDGKTFVKRYLLMNAGQEKTYNMARSAGYSRGRSYVKSIFDINGATIADAAISSLTGRAGSLAGGFVGGVVGGPVGAAIGGTVGSGLGSLVGHYTGGMSVAKKINESGKELSVQQKLIRNKYAKKNS